MKLIEAIGKIDDLNEDAFLYVRRTNGKFTINSEVVILELSDEELEWKTYEVTEKKCPGFEYFLEVFLIKELIDDLKYSNFNTIEKKCTRIIHYAENDA